MVEQLKEFTGQNAGSKALLCAGAQLITKMIPLERKCDRLEKELKNYQLKLRMIMEYRKTIEESEYAIKKLLSDSKFSAAAAAGSQDPEEY